MASFANTPPKKPRGAHWGYYALVRIAEDSDRDHTHIMAVVCACIRTNATPGSKDRNVCDIFGKNYRVGDEFGQ